MIRFLLVLSLIVVLCPAQPKVEQKSIKEPTETPGKEPTKEPVKESVKKTTKTPVKPKEPAEPKVEPEVEAKPVEEEEPATETVDEDPTGAPPAKEAAEPVEPTPATEVEEFVESGGEKTEIHDTVDIINAELAVDEGTVAENRAWRNFKRFRILPDVIDEDVAWDNLKSFIREVNAAEQSNAKEQAVSQASIDIETQLSLVKDELLAHIAGVIEENKVLREELESFKQVVVSKEEYGELLADIELMKQDIVSLKEATDKIDANVVQGIVTDALVLYDADKVGMPDYALESAGAVVFTIGETEPYTQDTPWMGVFGIPIWRSCKTPRLAIQIDNSPGNCWSFAGNKGTLTIQLAAQVFPEYFTLDHIPDALAPHGNASSAPSHFRVLGLDYGNAPKGHVLGNYEFTKLPLQTFAVQQNPYEKYFRFIKVEILSNRGNKDYTCLYRFRVHGVPHDTETFNG